LAQTQLLRDVIPNDTVLAVELSLLGPYAHVPECLAHRARPEVGYDQVLELMQIPGALPLEDSPEERMRLLLGLLDEAQVPMRERARCYLEALRYYAFLNGLFRLRRARHALGRELRSRGVPVDEILERVA